MFGYRLAELCLFPIVSSNAELNVAVVDMPAISRAVVPPNGSFFLSLRLKIFLNIPWGDPAFIKFLLLCGQKAQPPGGGWQFKADDRGSDGPMPALTSDDKERRNLRGR